jgi:hypothetical protein
MLCRNPRERRFPNPGEYGPNLGSHSGRTTLFGVDESQLTHVLSCLPASDETAVAFDLDLACENLEEVRFRTPLNNETASGFDNNHFAGLGQFLSQFTRMVSAHQLGAQKGIYQLAASSLSPEPPSKRTFADGGALNEFDHHGAFAAVMCC